MSRLTARVRHLPWFVSISAALALGALGCSASAPPREGGNGTDAGAAGLISGGGRPGTAGSTGVGAVTGIAGMATGDGGTCATSTADAVLEKEPVDIIVVLDNSGSMADELDAVERNINVNFATILASSGVDYRVILISRHRRDPRAASGESSTSICVQAPLSGLAACPGPQPVFSDRFFQYSTKIESLDSFDVTLDTFEPPFANDGREEKFGQAPLGWGAWLRPGAKKVFLEMTDDNATMTVQAFISELQTMSPENFGTDPARPNLVFHGIIGIREKGATAEAYLPTEPVMEAECTATDVANWGATYQELSRMTGGLRFPICQFAAYDVVFQTIANDVVVKANIACDFEIPASPDGRAIDRDKVAVNYTRADGSASKFGQAATSADCQADAFYITDQRVYLCPQTCDAVRAANGGSVDVLFTCESQIIVR